jgi:hypothetical protein
MRGWLGSCCTACVAAGLLSWAHAEDIYTCVDAKGRRLTSDRPIMECLDREQTQLNSSGRPVRKIGPAQTAEERAAEEEKAKREIEERKREAEEKKRDRALLSRYPDRATHDKERSAALVSIDEVIKTAYRRIEVLQAERKKIDTELEFYKSDPGKVPVQIKRKIEENEQLIAAQKRFIANQDEEKKRVNARYDQELARLKPMWAQQVAPVATTRSSSSAAR